MHRHVSVQELATTAAAQSRELATETAKQTRIAAQSSYKAAAEASKKAEIKLKQLAQDLNAKPGSGQVSKEQELQEAGITEELIDFIRGIDIKTFRQFPLEDALCILQYLHQGDGCFCNLPWNFNGLPSLFLIRMLPLAIITLLLG
jgi:uncharacterized FlaG/YvyC family protein